ncbi:hypothetical protein JCM15457_2156 [Liquorilactobacillus sucicola DSM 21376 = JCM 15457]|nr:hypothetical protein JCM15457_2156 [Liquorilactobacillus sucicola DSM 21376 = JCM 15457]
MTQTKNAPSTPPHQFHQTVFLRCNRLKDIFRSFIMTINHKVSVPTRNEMKAALIAE